MFNNRYGLTQAAVEERKTVTRRIEGGARFQEMAECAGEILYNIVDGTLDMKYEGLDIFSHKCRYRVGEVVAVAQSYNDATREFPHLKTTLVGHDIMGSELGCTNKMYVRADLMPHRIRITSIRCERLQDISDEDCLKEGVIGDYIGFYVPGIKCRNWEKESHVDTEDWKTWKLFPTPREAFASLIDKVSGRGTWERNPWMVVYEFETVK